MSELIKQRSFRSIEEWENWYNRENPEAIETATRKIMEMLRKMSETLNIIDENMVKRWVRDLVIVKTFVGMRFQEAILKKISEQKGTAYRLASPEEEARGIDGFVGNKSVSIKPATYKSKPDLSEILQADAIVFYEKKKDSIEIEFENL